MNRFHSFIHLLISRFEVRSSKFLDGWSIHFRFISFPFYPCPTSCLPLSIPFEQFRTCTSRSVANRPDKQASPVTTTKAQVHTDQLSHPAQ